MARVWLGRLRKWILRGGAVLAGVLLVVLGWLVVEGASSRSRLSAYKAELDRTDPGWRMQDLHRLRNERLPPAERNSVKLVLAAEGMTAGWNGPDGWNKRVMDRNAGGSDWLPEIEINRRPRPIELADARCLRDDNIDALNTLLQLRHLTEPGGVARQIGDDPFGILLPDVQEQRWAAQALQVDAVVSAAAGDTDRAADSVLGLLAVARGMGDGSFLIEMLVRIAISQVGCNTAERVLALCEPSEEKLAAWQAAFQAEAEVPRFRHALRGERAALDHFMTNVANGKLTVGAAAAAVGGPGGVGNRAAVWVYKQQFLPSDHLFALELFTKWIGETEKRHQDRADPGKDIPKAPTLRHLFSRQLMPSVEKCAAADQRSTAALRCATAAVACERFRQKHGRWPTHLTEVKEYLPTVPTDPYDGQPLRYARYAGGAVVYSVGTDKQDGGGNISWRAEPGTDYGFRLWDVSRRAAEPLPEPEAQLGDM